MSSRFVSKDLGRPILRSARWRPSDGVVGLRRPSLDGGFHPRRSDFRHFRHCIWTGPMFQFGVPRPGLGTRFGPREGQTPHRSDFSHFRHCIWGVRFFILGDCSALPTDVRENGPAPVKVTLELSNNGVAAVAARRRAAPNPVEPAAPGRLAPRTGTTRTAVERSAALRVGEALDPKKRTQKRSVRGVRDREGAPERRPWRTNAS
jgi:hypothetical protein